MKRTDAPGATVDNQFTDGDPTGGVPSTVLEQSWLNNVQEEIAHVIEEAGITLDGNDMTQLLEAILYFISQNIVADGDRGDITVTVGGTVWTIDNGVITPQKLNASMYSTQSDAELGIENVKLMTALRVAQAIDYKFAHSFGTNGYQKIPGGLIIQWGQVVGALDQSSATVTLPVTFPNAFLSLQVAPYRASDYGSNNTAVSYSGEIVSTSQLKIHGAHVVELPDGAYWLAIGY